MITRLIAISLLTATSPVYSEDWNRFRGPNGQGVSEASVPVEWSAEKNMKWKRELPGMGSSSPVVAGGKVFVTSFSGVGEGSTDTTKLVRHLMCVDRTNGEVLWQKDFPNTVAEDAYGGFLREHGYASNSPVVDDGKVFAFLGKGGIHAFDIDGKPLWDKKLGTGSASKRWGSAASPMVVDGVLVVNASEEALTVFGLDPATGEEKWKAEGDSLELAYGTPVVRESKAGRKDLVLAVPGELWGMNPMTGKLRWYGAISSKGNISPSPVLGEDTVYVFGGYPSLRRSALKIGEAKGELPEENTVWEDKDSSYVPTPVLVDGHLYWASDSGYAMCVNAKTGATVFKERLDAQGQGARGKPFYAGAVVADGKVIAVSRRGGTFVFDAKPEFKLLAHNKIDGDDSQFHGTPALSDGQVFLRSDEALYCIGE